MPWTLCCSPSAYLRGDLRPWTTRTGAIPAPRLVLSRAHLPAPVCPVCQEGQIYCGLMTCPEPGCPAPVPLPPSCCQACKGESVPTSGSVHPPTTGTEPWTVRGTRGHPAQFLPQGGGLAAPLRQLSLCQRLMCSICIVIPGSRKEGMESEAGREGKTAQECVGELALT